MVPVGYETKFADFIRLCADAKGQGLDRVIIAYPQVIGDTYEEIIGSLKRLADAGLVLEIAASGND